MIVFGLHVYFVEMNLFNLYQLRSIIEQSIGILCWLSYWSA